MLPFNPSTSFIRSAKLVREEWSLYFSPSSPYPAQNVAGGWRGILYANLATIDPKASWDFFARNDFDPAWIDSGTTRTWALICAGGEFQTLNSLQSNSRKWRLGRMH